MTGGGWFYPRTAAGLLECYTMAIPFFRNSLLGDIGDAAVLFGLFELVEHSSKYFEKPQTEKIKK
jgi:hypothetical protein